MDLPAEGKKSTKGLTKLTKPTKKSVQLPLFGQKFVRQTHAHRQSKHTASAAGNALVTI